MSKITTQHRPARADQPAIAGRARDGVKILRQVPGPSSFTRQQAERVMERIKSGLVQGAAEQPAMDASK